MSTPIGGDPRQPKRIKAHERPATYWVEGQEPTTEYYGENDIATGHVTLNAGYVNLTYEQFLPKTGCKYMWVVNQNYEIIIGTEDIGAFTGPFVVEADILGGHPTLAVTFTDDGQSIAGPAYIAGTLYEDEDENGIPYWTINDASGRYSAGNSGNEQRLQEVLQILGPKLGLDLKMALKQRS